MTFTAHGHHIPGSPTDDENLEWARARCGGPGVCVPCSREASLFAAQDIPKVELSDFNPEEYLETPAGPANQDEYDIAAMYDEEPAEEGNLYKHAKRELELLGEESAVVEGYLEMIKIFAKMGHSGASAFIFIHTLSDLMQFKNLTELTDDPDEWIHVGEEVWGKAPGIWQSSRNSEAFSNDGGKTYYLLSEGIDGSPLHDSKKKTDDNQKLF